MIFISKCYLNATIVEFGCVFDVNLISFFYIFAMGEL